MSGLGDLQSAVIGLLGGNQADSETISLLEQIVSNINAGKTGNPTIPFLPSLGGGGGASDSGLGINVINPYLRAYLYQQEYPYAFPIAILAIGGLSIYGLVKLFNL